MIAIIGNGKGGQLIAHYFNNKKDSILGESCGFEFFDDFKGTPIKKIPDGYKLIISSSNMSFRREVFTKFNRERFINVDRSNNPMQPMGVGNLIFPNVHFDCFSEIGDNNVISNGTIINHHCKVGSGNLFGPGCLLSGSVIIGNNCTIGSGVIFEPNVVIGDNVTIASGSVIVNGIVSCSAVMAIKKLESSSVYQGNRTIKTRKK